MQELGINDRLRLIQNMAFKALSLKERKRGGYKLKSSAQSLSIPHWGWGNHDIPTIMLYNQAWKPGPQIWQTNGAIRSKS